MALKSVIVSDVSGKDIPEDKHARIVINGYPSISGSVELDVTTDEAAKLQGTPLNLINCTVYAPNERPRQVVIDTDSLATAFGKNVDIGAVLRGARRVGSDGAPKQRAARGTAAKGDKVDYCSPDHYGQLHRGRVTEAEAALVRENREQASRNRQAQTGKPIDFDDAKELARYGM